MSGAVVSVSPTTAAVTKTLTASEPRMMSSQVVLDLPQRSRPVAVEQCVLPAVETSIIAGVVTLKTLQFDSSADLARHAALLFTVTSAPGRTSIILIVTHSVQLTSCCQSLYQLQL